MRVNDQEDMLIPEASCLPYLRPGVMTWPIASGACWSPCCRRGRRQGARRSGPGGSSSTGSAGGSGPAPRGGTSRRATAPGSRCTGCSAAGSTVASTRPTKWPNAAQLALIDSIREFGILEPLQICGRYLRDGHHRYYAAVWLGLLELPTIDAPGPRTVPASPVPGWTAQG